MRLFFTLSLALVSLLSFGQELPLYNQYVFDPYVVNPSYVGRSGFSEINLLYRAQWTGVDNAPNTAAINLQYVASPRIALGLSVYNDEVILLSTTSAMATFGYRVPLGRNNNLSFGLSAGVNSNRIHLDELDPEDLSDPVFKNASNTTQLDGQFGVNYTSKNFTLGFSLLRLFENQAFVTADKTSVKFSELQNKLITVGYRIPLGSNFELNPYVSYRFNSYNSFFEATGVITFKQAFSIGGFYRQDYGPGFIVRLKLNPKIEFGYSHEFATSQAKTYLGGSHEAQFKLKLGSQMKDLLTKREEQEGDSTVTQVAKRQEQKKDSTATSPPLPQDKPVVESRNEVQTPPTNPVETTNPVVKTDPPAVPVTEPVQTPAVAQEEDKPKEKYSLVIGTFSSSSNAVAFLREARGKGIQCEMSFQEDTGYYYVFATQYEAEDPTLDHLLSIRHKIPYKDAWFKKNPKKE